MQTRMCIIYYPRNKINDNVTAIITAASDKYVFWKKYCKKKNVVPWVINKLELESVNTCELIRR